MKKFIKVISVIVCLTDLASCKIDLEYEGGKIYTDKSPENSSMGYKTLRSGNSFASQVSSQNYVYIVDSSFDLGGASAAIGENSILKFTKNGSIKNGTVTFNNTYLDGDPCFRMLSLRETF